MRFLKLLATLIGIALSVQATAQDAQTRLRPAAAAPIATVKPHASLVTGQVPVNRNSGTPVLIRTDLEAWLDGFMPYAIRSSDIAGAVVVVVKDGRVLAQRGYGYSDIDKRTPVDPDRTLFRPASISKLFTWTAVMQLVEQGRLDLDKDVNAYLDFRIPPSPGRQASHLAPNHDAHRRLRRGSKVYHVL